MVMFGEELNNKAVSLLIRWQARLNLYLDDVIDARLQIFPLPNLIF